MSLQTAGLSGCFFSRRPSFASLPPSPPSSFLHSFLGALSTIWKFERNQKLKRERESSLSLLLGPKIQCVSTGGLGRSLQGDLSKGLVRVSCSAHAAQPEFPQGLAPQFLPLAEPSCGEADWGTPGHLG